jgi:hypothetical protein
MPAVAFCLARSPNFGPPAPAPPAVLIPADALAVDHKLPNASPDDFAAAGLAAEEPLPKEPVDWAMPGRAPAGALLAAEATEMEVK